MTAFRYFRAGPGRTITMPFGLLEGPTTRISAPDVEHRTWTDDGKHRPLARGIHAELVEIEVDRINGKATGLPFDRFINGLVRDGDLVELDADDPAVKKLLADREAAEKAAKAANAAAKSPAPAPARAPGDTAVKATSKESTP